MKQYYFKLTTFKELIKVVFLWRIWLFIVALSATLLIEKNNYPFPYADSILIPTGLPKWVWGFANFDGVHYIRTALWGYTSEYSQAFFPFYPLMISALSSWNIFDINNKTILLINGLVISLFSFLVGTYFYRKILLYDYKDKVVNLSLLVLLFFPTSFYFAALYTESIFFLLSTIAIFLVLKKKYIFAGVFIALATATKITGVFLIIIYLIEMVTEMRRGHFKENISDLSLKLFGLFISGSGLLLYMFYLYINFYNPVYFLTAQPVFGASRQVDQLVILPQVFYRYSKILMTVPFLSSQFYIALNELVFSLFGLLLLIISWGKVRLSYWLFSLSVYLLPTLTGTLSSMPRYVLLLFLLLPAIVNITGSKTKYLIFGSFLLQILFTSLFILGFWIA